MVQDSCVLYAWSSQIRMNPAGRTVYEPFETRKVCNFQLEADAHSRARGQGLLHPGRFGAFEWPRWSQSVPGVEQGLHVRTAQVFEECEWYLEDGGDVRVKVENALQAESLRSAMESKTEFTPEDLSQKV